MNDEAILLVEDNPADVYLVRKALERSGIDCPVIVIEDGALALSFIRSDGADTKRPSLVVLDLNLPKNDGVEVLEALRASQWLAGVPAAVLTTSRSPRDKALVERYPGVAFIPKPVELDEFLSIGDTLRDMLERTASKNAGTSL